MFVYIPTPPQKKKNIENQSIYVYTQTQSSNIYSIKRNMKSLSLKAKQRTNNKSQSTNGYFRINLNYA